MSLDAFQLKAKRDAATIRIMRNEIAMLRKIQGQLREELESYRVHTPSPAVVEHNQTAGLSRCPKESA